MILGRYYDAVFPDYSRFLADSGDDLDAFFTDPRHGRFFGKYVPGAKDLYARLCLLYS